MAKRRNNSSSGWKRFKRRLAFALYNWVGFPILWIILKLYPLSFRWRPHNIQMAFDLFDSGRPLIFAFWHEDLLNILWAGRKFIDVSHVYIMISPSRDGLFLGRIVRSLDYRVVEGSSSSRGLSGFRNLRQILKSGDYAAIAVDGPRGPRRKVKNGVLMLSKMTDAVIIPVVFHASRKWSAKSWDRMEIPKPFSTIDVVILDTVTMGEDGSIDDHCGALEDRLNSAKDVRP